MKSNFQFSRPKLAAQSMLLGLAFLIGDTVNAQNLLNNPGFEAPISTSGTTNWVVAYALGGTDDFCIRDRTTFARRTGAGSYGGQFRPMTEGVMHAYFKQTVSGLATNQNYIVRGWMMNTWPAGVTAGKYVVYIESVGVTNASTPTSTSSTWTQFAVTNTPKLNGTMEVRLHFDKVGATEVTDQKMRECTGCWDDIELFHQ